MNRHIGDNLWSSSPDFMGEDRHDLVSKLACADDTAWVERWALIVIRFKTPRNVPGNNMKTRPVQIYRVSREGVVSRDAKMLKISVGVSGVEITVDNVAALYLKDAFHVTLKLAELPASLIGMMNLFARALGG